MNRMNLNIGYLLMPFGSASVSGDGMRTAPGPAVPGLAGEPALAFEALSDSASDDRRGAIEEALS